MSQPKWKGQFCKQSNLAKSTNFVSKFKVKYAIEEQSQCLEESENKIGEGFRFNDLNSLIEQLKSITL